MNPILKNISAILLSIAITPILSQEGSAASRYVSPVSAMQVVQDVFLPPNYRGTESRSSIIAAFRPDGSKTPGLQLPIVGPDESYTYDPNVAIRPKLRPDNIEARYKRALPKSMIGQSSETCLQIAIYHEARSETSYGQKAVASVILQRAELPEYFGQGICGVISKPKAFSYVRDDLSIPPITELDAWMNAGRIARDMLASGPLPDLKGADHYHTYAVYPKWRHKMVRVKKIGAHIFYADPALDYHS